jgi:hypothetical protein
MDPDQCRLCLYSANGETKIPWTVQLSVSQEFTHANRRATVVRFEQTDI